MFQQVRTGTEDPVDMDAGDRPAGTDGCVAVDAEGDDRKVKAFTEAACGETDEAGIPVFTGYDDDMRGGEAKGCLATFFTIKSRLLSW